MMLLSRPVGAHDHAQGKVRAPPTLVEYGDFQCPDSRAACQVVQALQGQFQDQLRFVFRNFPRTQGNSRTLLPACTAEFASEHGFFWEVYSALYQTHAEVDLRFYARLVARNGLSTIALRSALAAGVYEGRVRRDIEDGLRSGVDRAPTFFINGRAYGGPIERVAMAAAMSEALEKRAISAA